MAKPISIIPNDTTAIVVKVLPATNTKPQRYKVSLGKNWKIYSRSSLSEDVKEGAIIAIKQFITDYEAGFFTYDTTFILGSIPDGFVAVLVKEITLKRINEL